MSAEAVRLSQCWRDVVMTTTWPRYRNIEPDDCGPCNYSTATYHQEYPSETYPRPGHCCQLDQQEQAPVLPHKSKSAKREHREREREREHRQRSQDHHHQPTAHHSQQSHHQQSHHQSHHSQQSHPQQSNHSQQSHHVQQSHHQQSNHSQQSHPQQSNHSQQPQHVQQSHPQPPQPPPQPPPPPGPQQPPAVGAPGEGREREDCVDCVGMQEAPQHGYTGRPTPREVEQGQAGQGKREREGVESGYSTQNREDRDKEANKTGKSESEQIQYIDGEGCQVWRPQPIEPPSLDTQYSTIHKSPSRRKSRAMARSVPGTLDRRGHHDIMDDGLDMPLTPASFAGLDHKELEERPLTSMTARMGKCTMYDDPPEKTSLFITCSCLYAILLVIICLAFLTSEVVTDNSPLHYYEGFFSFLYLLSIFFLFYVFCYLLHESTCCRGDPEPATYFQGGMDYGGLSDYPHCQIKLKKYKTSENEQSHGSFFLRVGGLAFGLGTMVYIGLEFGSWFEVPWNSPCYQAVRGVNPVLQLIFTFSQMYFVFMNSRLNIHQFKCLARFGLMHIVATNVCVWIRTVFKEAIKDIAAYRVAKGEGVSEDYMIKEGYSILRQRFGNDSFWIHGPYHFIMKAIFQGTGVYRAFSLHPFTTGPPMPPMTSTTRAPPPFNPGYNNPLYPGNQHHQQQPHSSLSSPGQIGGYDNMYPGQNRAGFNNIIPFNQTRQHSGMPGYHQPNSYGQGGLDSLTQQTYHAAQEKFDNFTCGRIDLMGNIVTKSAPYLYPFVIEFSLIIAAILLVMWLRIGKNPRFWGDDELDRLSVTSRKMVTYTRVDCVGASKGLFFGLLVLVSALICLILFFVLIDHGELHVSQLAVFLADISHATIMLLSLLAILIGFCRIKQLKFHGEEDSLLTTGLLKVAALGVFGYASFSIIAGCLGDYRRPPNLVVMVTGIISIVQVILQLLFIQDVARRRISSADQDRSKPGRQIVTFLLICNLSIWVIYTFEVQKVEESPVQIEFFGYQAWVIIQKLTLPLCIFFRFHSTVALAEIWKNSYKTKLID